MVETKVLPSAGQLGRVTSLPVPPRIIFRVIQVAAEPDSTAAQLSKLISKDPTLTAQVLRAVNSAYYGLRRRIDTVHHAVAFMGMGAVRNLVLCMGVQQLVQREDVGDFPLDDFWECSARRAAAASCLARRLGVPEPDEFFTLGLCQDIGILILLRQSPSFGPGFAGCLDQPAAARLLVEAELGPTHDEIGADLLETWKLPDELVTAVRYHHRPEEAPAAVRGRCAIAIAAEAVADLLQVRDKSGALELAQEQIERLQLPATLLRAIVEEVVEDVAEVADMLEVRVGPQPTYEEIVARASEALVSLSLTPPGHADPSRREQHLLTAELQHRNEELRRQAATDALTGLANRRMLDETLARDLAQTCRQEAWLSVLLLDIDRFKSLNDGHGHQAGDSVLCRVADVVRQMIRKSDLCARYGGEEFAVVLPFTPEEGARIVAERIRLAVSDAVVDWEGKCLSVTVSIGCVTIRGSASEITAERVMRDADTALYRAKGEGRNRVHWHPAGQP